MKEDRFYWLRLAVVSLIWFIYDFSAYSFSIYSTQWISIILGDDTSLWKSFGWGTLVNAFYLPGAIAGAYISDWIGPRRALYIFVFLQGCVGFLMAGLYGILDTKANVAGFVVIYGYVRFGSRVSRFPPFLKMIFFITVSSSPLVKPAPVIISALSHPKPPPLPSAANTTPSPPRAAKSAPSSAPTSSPLFRITLPVGRNQRVVVKTHFLLAAVCACLARCWRGRCCRRLDRIRFRRRM